MDNLVFIKETKKRESEKSLLILFLFGGVND